MDHRGRHVRKRRLIPALLAAAALAACVPAVVTATAPQPSFTPSPQPSSLGRATVPGAFNPDVTQATIGSTVCVAGWTATVRPPVGYTNALKKQQLAGAADKDPTHYEEDHLVPLSIGGSPRDPSNLWPEPLAVARVKDIDELALNKKVCSGAITLAAAQAEILRKWGPG